MLATRSKADVAYPVKKYDDKQKRSKQEVACVKQLDDSFFFYCQTMLSFQVSIPINKEI